MKSVILISILVSFAIRVFLELVVIHYMRRL